MQHKKLIGPVGDFFHAFSLSKYECSMARYVAVGIAYSWKDYVVKYCRHIDYDTLIPSIEHQVRG